MEQCISCKYCGNDIERDPCRGCTFGSGFGSNWEPAGEKSQWIPASKPPKVHRVPNSSPAAHLLSDPVLTYRADGIPKYNVSVYTRGESEVCGCWYTHDMIIVAPDWWIPLPELPKEETP